MHNKTACWYKIGLLYSVYIIVSLSIWAVFFPQEIPFKICQNVSDSLPFSFFVSTKLKEIKSGIYVTLEHPHSHLLLAKQIIGLPGDCITIRGQIFHINGKAFGSVQEKTPSGYSIHPISEGIIPEGYLFAYASHPNSYDSRYAEFGLVPISALKDKLWPLF